MAESIYRRKPEGNVRSVLTQRSQLLKNDSNTIHGKSAQVRDPVFISITGQCNKCTGKVKDMTLSRFEDTWQEVYQPSSKFKPSPQLESVTIECIGDYGLARKISATIRCYKAKDFEEVIDAFLLPGNKISADFNHKIHWGIKDYGHVEDYRVATFNFTTTTEGHWVCSFTAVSAATAIKNADIQIKVRSNLTYKEAGSIEPTETHIVNSIAQLIAADCQKDGKVSTDEFTHSFLITDFKDYQPGIELPNGAKPSIKLFNGDYLRSASGYFGWSKTELPKDDVDKTTNQIYVTLGYIINRIINDQILGSIKFTIGGDDQEAYSKLKIRFDSILSKSKITPHIKSGDPLSILLHGPGGFTSPRGNYKYSGAGRTGINFEEKIPDPVSVTGNNDVLTWNILINRNTVNQAYTAAIKEKEAKSDSTSLQVQKEEVVNLNSFLDNIFRSISDAMGGSINLTLIEDPKDPNHLLVIDQNYGESTTIPCFVFDPIDGDGCTRSCVIESNVGSTEYQSTMFMGSSKRGDPMTQLRGCTPEMEKARDFNYNAAKVQAIFLVAIGGHFAKNNYNATDIQALKSLMGSLYHNRPEAAKYEALHFPGMRITVDLDGVWGFIPGNAISTTQLPLSWRSKNVYFMVTNVVHTFQENDWQTTLSGIMGYYDNLEMVYL